MNRRRVGNNFNKNNFVTEKKHLKSIKIILFLGSIGFISLYKLIIYIFKMYNLAREIDTSQLNKQKKLESYKYSKLNINSIDLTWLDEN